MASKSLVFVLQSFRIYINFYPQRSSREGSHAERLEFLCESPLGTYQTVLDSDTSFLYFDSLSHFFGYMRRNSKKDIVEFDGREFLSVHVHSSEGYHGMEPINLIQSCRINQQAAIIERYTHSYERQKGIMMETLSKAFRAYMKSRKRVIKVRQQDQQMVNIKEDETIDKPFIIFSLGHANHEDTSNTQFHLSVATPIFEFQLPLQQFAHSAFKVKVQKMNCGYLALGIRYKVAQSDQYIKYQCLFGKTNVDAFQIDKGHQLEICWQDTSLAIKNSTNSQCKLFNHPSIDPTIIRNCVVYLSLGPVRE